MSTFGSRGNLSARTRFASNRAAATDAALIATIPHAHSPQRECARLGFVASINCDREEQPRANFSAPRRQFTRHTMSSKFHANSLKTNDWYPHKVTHISRVRGRTLATKHSPLATAFLIDTPAIRNTLKSNQSNAELISNRHRSRGVLPGRLCETHRSSRHSEELHKSGNHVCRAKDRGATWKSIPAPITNHHSLFTNLLSSFSRDGILVVIRRNVNVRIELVGFRRAARPAGVRESGREAGRRPGPSLCSS